MFKIYAKYLSDSEIRTLCDDNNFITKMIKVEIALAKAESELGLIPIKAAKEIEQLSEQKIDVEKLATSTLEHGIPVIGLLKQLKEALSDTAKEYLHWGATSQDIVDSAQILVIKEILMVFENRIESIIIAFNSIGLKHQNTLMAGRTRNQQAAPISFNQKVQSWINPLIRHQQRLEELKPRLFNLQFAGSVGNMSAFDGQGELVAKKIGKELGLDYLGTWHSQRDNMAEFSSWIALMAGSLGKVANDFLLLSQTEVGELNENKNVGGASSTMPHKQNPVLSEAIVGLSNFIASLNIAVQQSLIHAQERDGKALVLEWMALPQMMIALGTMLKHMNTISENMEVYPERMIKNIENNFNLIFSEKVSLVLSKKYGRTEGRRLTNEICEKALNTKTSLNNILLQAYPNLKQEWKQIFNLK